MLPSEFKSSKFRTCCYFTAMAAVPTVFTVMNKSVSWDQKQQTIMLFMGTIGAIWGIGINGAYKVDAADKAANTTTTVVPPTVPSQTQTNTLETLKDIQNFVKDQTK